MRKLFSALSLLAIGSLFATNEEATRPNIIIIMCDDLGYADVGFNGSSDIRTPHLDKLAEEGIHCTSGYVPHPFCGPSRMGMMTGRYPHSFGTPFNLPAASRGYKKYNKLGIPTNEVLLSKMLQNNGYYTGLVGKWHLGVTPDYHPNVRGFDDFYGFLGGGHSYFPKVYQAKYNAAKARGTKKIFDYLLPLEHNGEQVQETEYLTDGLSREACRFIKEASQKEDPFFLFLAYNAPHSPLEAKEEDKAQFLNITDENRRTIAGMIFAVDRGVGRIVDTLEKTKKADNTLIVFLSDNGGKVEYGSNNHPLRGSKGDTLEGGYRVPFFFHWPAGFSQARKYPHPVSSLDFYPTFAALAGGEIPADKKLAGKNLLPFLESGKNARPGEMIYTLRHRMSKGDRSHHQVGGRRDQWKSYYDLDGWKLYNVQIDPGEKNNLAEKHPKILQQLVTEMSEWAQTHSTPQWFDDPAQEKRWHDQELPFYDKTFTLEPTHPQ